MRWMRAWVLILSESAAADVLLQAPMSAAVRLPGVAGQAPAALRPLQMTPTSLIEATTARFTARAEHRHEPEATLATGSPRVAAALAPPRQPVDWPLKWAAWRRVASSSGRLREGSTAGVCAGRPALSSQEDVAYRVLPANCDADVTCTTATAFPALMIRMPLLLLAVASLVAETPLYAQQLLVARESCAYFSASTAPETYAFRPDVAATGQLNEILTIASVSQSFDFNAGNVPLAATIVTSERRLILYRQDIAANRAESQRWPLTAALAHQVAHQMFRHSLAAAPGRREQELEADKFSGTILRILGASLNDATVALREPTQQSSRDRYFPTIEARLWAVGAGWNTAEAVAMHGYSVEDVLPRFDLPPPISSALVPVPIRQWVPRGPRNLGDASERLAAIAKDSGGYVALRYWAVRDGFAAATPIEKINDDGSPHSSDRWSLTLSPPRIFSLSSYLKALFSATKGRYRMIVFVVSPHPFAQRAVPVKFQPSIDWLWSGLTHLPPSLASTPLDDSFRCTVLIYEFEQVDTYTEPFLRAPSALDGRRHLQMAGLWSALNQ